MNQETETSSARRLTSLEVCAGAGGLALGLERAGFDPVLLLDNHEVACKTLGLNRPAWDVRQIDLVDFDPDLNRQVHDVDLLAAGLPRVKASAAVGRLRGDDSELALLRATAFLAHAVQPRALLVENMADLVTKPQYEGVREDMRRELVHLGYRLEWFVINASGFDVPQDRKMGFLVALKGDAMDFFEVPHPVAHDKTVGSVLETSMGSRGWADAGVWAAQADRLAPTLVGGSWERGGADLGPSGTKRTWDAMGVNGGTVADDVPGPDFDWNPSAGRSHMVALTVPQVALLQGFPPDWELAGRKTAQYRQLGNAVPPPVGEAVGRAVAAALRAC